MNPAFIWGGEFVIGKKCSADHSHIAGFSCSLGNGAESTALNIKGSREHP
jgi:hypothetical protein